VQRNVPHVLLSGVATYLKNIRAGIEAVAQTRGSHGLVDQSDRYPPGVLPLICIDVDGTLVGASGQPTQAVWAAADAAIARGQHLALSTARAAFGPTFQWARRLDPAGWHVFHAGAALVHTGTGDVIERTLPAAAVDTAMHAAAQHGWTVEFYAAADYRVSDDSNMAIAHANLMGVPHTLGGPGDLNGDVVRVQFVIPHEAVPAATEIMAAHVEVSSATSPVQEGATFVSLTQPGATKAAALINMAELLDTTIERVMMVGDGHNDLGAIKTVGHGVAMGNAEPEVKAVANHLVADVAHDGLADALELSATL
jgi:Cof subfamily protein (haloacid dehalogenase superfamily)